ncbi:hypothetical protein [Simplicispira psychrophila]|uniref:hypothetical protein n=1 Tax=Simplicispira psychrophila TaxID=80882 RepID=UPI0012EC21CD|nr:hypothetical protein [Simplicispira psychrophila]
MAKAFFIPIKFSLLNQSIKIKCADIFIGNVKNIDLGCAAFKIQRAPAQVRKTD